MKKRISILAILFCAIAFTSCTDQTSKTVELIQTENELETFVIDKRRIRGPNGGSTSGADYNEE